MDVPFLLSSWVTSTPHIIVASTQLQVDTTCPVVINSLEPKSCPVASVTPPTGPSSDSSVDPPTDHPTDVTVVAAAVCIVVLLVVVAIIIAIVMAVVLFNRKRSKYR